MKTRFTFSYVILIMAFHFGPVSLINAQIPNPGFETWYTSSNGYDPAGWITSNASPFVSVEQATPAYQGNYSVRVKTWQAGLIVVAGVCQSDGFHYSSRPTALTGVAKCTVMPGDSISIVVTVTLGGLDGVGVGAARKIYASSVSAFTAFNIPIDYVSASSTDSIYIDILVGRANTPSLGTEIVVDELSLSEATGINMVSSVTKMNFQFNDENNNLTITGENLKLLEIFDLSGRCITKNGLNNTTGQIEFNTNMLTKGIYLVRISNSKNEVFARKILK